MGGVHRKTGMGSSLRLTMYTVDMLSPEGTKEPWPFDRQEGLVVAAITESPDAARERIQQDRTS